MNIGKKGRGLNKQVIVLVIGVVTSLLLLNTASLFRPLLGRFITSEIIVSKGAHIMMCASMGLILYIIHKFMMPLISGSDFKKPDFRASILGILGIVSAMAGIQRTVILLNFFVDCSLLTAGNIGSELYGGLTFAEKIVFIASASIVVPIMEEVIFRGLIFGALNRLLNLHAAAVLSALLFGILHGVSIFTVLGTGLMGLFLAYIYGIYGNLGNAICVHAVYNLIVIISTMISKAAVVSAGSPAAGTSVVLSVILIAFYGYIIRHIVKLLRRDLMVLSDKFAA